jgi:hypothetical protein
LHVHGRGARTDACSRSQVKLILSPKQRAKPAASRTRTGTNAAVCIAQAVASRCFRRRLQQLVCACGS